MSKLSHQLVSQADVILDALTREYQTSHTELKQLLQFSQLLSKQFLIFSTELTEVAQQFFNKKVGKEKSHWSVQLDALKEGLEGVTQMLTRASKDIEEVVSVPLELFVPQFVETYDRLKTTATSLKDDIINIVSLPSQKIHKPCGFLGYNGVLMSRKRSIKIDISDHQSKYSQLVKELNLLHSNKYRTIKSAYQHLTNVLNQLNEENKLQILELKSDRQSQTSSSISMSQDLIQQIRYQCQDMKLLKLIPQDPNLQHFTLPELLESRIENEVESLLKITHYSDPHIKSLILQDTNNIKYFLDCLNCEVESQIVLTPIKYFELATMMKHILKLVISQKGNQDIIHTILLISLRIHCQGRVLIKQLSKDEGYWLKLQSWLDLLDHLIYEIDKQKQSKEVSPTKTIHSPSRPKSILSRSLLKLWSSSTNDTKQNENIAALEVLSEINTFLIKLQIPNEFAIKVILSLCQKQKISKHHFQKLINQQKLSKRESLDRKYSSSLNIKLRKQKKMLSVDFNRLTSVIKSTLPFLGISDYYTILLVNKTFNQKLSHPIHKQLLQFQTSTTISKYRVNLYKLLLKASKHSKQEYQQLASQVPKQLKTSGVIYQDAIRCLKWSPNHQPMMIEVLSCYSFHHPDVKYIQGMHCLCEHLFRIEPNNLEQVYSMFQTLVETYFKDIVKSTFEKLRLRMYQYSRVLEIHYPKIAEHFIKQKLQTQHYIIQWFLTLWGDKQGEIVNIMWDGFVVSGWRWCIKVCAWLVGVYEKQLLLLNFDSILNNINNDIEITALNYSLKDLEQLVEQPEKIREKIDQIKISRSFQKDLELEFDYSDYKLTPFLNTPLNS